MAEAATPSPTRLDIKKYPNRRYYDATRSRHVTLEEINNLIRDGYEIHVTDSKTGQDITAKVLTQIILEMDAPKLDVFSVPLLHRLIRANQTLVSDFVEKYFNQALAAFLDSQRSLEQSMRNAMGLQQPLPGISDWTKLMWGPFWSAQRARSPETPAEAAAGQPAPPAPAPEATNNKDVRQLVEELRQQLSSLQEQLASTKSKPKPRRKD